MNKFFANHHTPRMAGSEVKTHQDSDGFYLLISLIAIFAISTLAILIGLGLAMIA
jgi:hypothetical protein